MIENITIKNEASFDETGQTIGNLKKVNFFYGANGSGKTTISRVIDNEDQYDESSLSWNNGNKLKTFVYNRDFVSRNFSPDEELKGIFTLGENEGNAIEAIKTANSERDAIVEKIDTNNKTLAGEDGESGKKGELKTLEDSFTEDCWTYKKKYEDVFKSAFKGSLRTETFKTRTLNEININNANLLSIEELKEKAGNIFADTLEEENPIPTISYIDLINLENNETLSKKIVGKDDVDIAAMIKKLDNSAWVKQGRSYFDQNDGYCPFCQQKAEDNFANSLEEYFNETYQNDLDKIETLATNYDSYSSAILQRIDGILATNPKYMDCEKLQIQKDAVEAKINANKQHIVRKKKEASSVITLEPLQDTLTEISEEIKAANIKVKKHNETINNITKERAALTSQIWRFIVEEIKTTYDTYASKKDDFDKAISSLKENIEKLKTEKAIKSNEIQNLEKEITSIQPTVDSINSILKEFGFTNFSLSSSEQKGFYNIIRPNGDIATETLSEGEKTFVTFLYFYHLLKGSNTTSGITEDRIIVFDDPVSSLDSDVLFIVSNLIKNIFKEVRSNTGNIKQVFVLTHNIYFHKEISFDVKQSKTFWIIKKNSDNRSIADFHQTNPIKNSYELLWQEVQKPNRSKSTIRNTLRRILEHYFKILGGINLDELANKFEGKDKTICGILLSWVHDGSHYTDEDLYIACDDDTVEKYLNVFKGIFDKSNNTGHYNMMMKISKDEKTASNTNIPNTANTA